MSLIVETKSLRTTHIKISPYIPENEERMGLEKYGEILMPGAKQREQMACRESTTGVKMYITGLNELDMTVMRLPEKEKAARVLQIRTDICHLERILAANDIDKKFTLPTVSTSDFMAKVLFIKPDNHKLWDEIMVTLTNGDIFLDVENNPYDLIKLRSIEAGGFDLIAASYSDAKKSGQARWFLDRHEKTTSDKVVLSKVKNTAIAALEELYKTDAEKLRFVLKYLLEDCTEYKPATPIDSLYEDADNYINGRGEERAIKKAANNFIEASEKKIEDLKLISIIKDANKYNFLVTKGDGKVYHQKSNSMIGSNIEDCVQYLKNPLNSKLLDDVMSSVEKEWMK